MSIFFQLSLITFGVILLVNMVGVLKTGGLSKHNIHLYVLGVSSYYLMLAPTVTGFTEEWVLFSPGWSSSTDIEDIFDFGMLMISLHFACYTIGYFMVFRRQNVGKTDYSAGSERFFVRSGIEAKIFFLFLFFYAVIYLNTLAGGVRLVDVFLGVYGKATLGLKGYTYYLQNFADSLILVLIAGYYFKIKPLYFRVMLALAIPLFLVLGFRYRIILTVFGLSIIFLRDNQVRLATVFKALVFVTVFVFSMLVLTQNRAAIFMQEWDNLNFDITELPYEALVEQAKGSRIDFSVYKAVFDGTIEYDFGETMFVYPLIKLLPSFVFNNGEKPYPSPQIRDIHIALDSGIHIGEAVTSIGSSFYSFGVTGILLFSLLLGLVVGKLQNNFGKTRFSGLYSIAIALALFMWITRGYTPGFIDHLGFMLIPIFMLNFLYRGRMRRKSMPRELLSKDSFK